MRSVIQTAVRRTVTVCMVVVIVFAAGILAAQSTPVSLLPDIAVPALGVLVTYPGASAASVEEQVTRPLDDALRSVGGATRLQTYSMDNAAALFFYFDYGVDLEEKSDEIRACIAKLELPAECAEPTLTTVDLNASAVATIAVWREDDDTEKLLADAQTLRGVLAGVEGVGDVVLTGAPADEIAVAPLQGLEMATLLLYETLSMGALDIPLGSYFEDGSPVSVRNVSDAATPEELGSLPVELSFDRAVWTTLAGLAAQIAELEVQNGSPLTDEQVALLVSAGGMADALPFTVTPALVGLVRGLDYTRVTYDASETGRLIVPVSKIADVERVRTYETYSYYNGRPSVTVEVMAAAGANAVDISEAVRARLDGLHLDSSVLLLDDEAEFINDSIGNILSSLLIGGVLAVAVIFVFLRRFSLSLIISVTMPLSVLAAIAALYLLGVTFNMVSLGGLAVGIGMLVDNSIVVIESITKRRDKGEEAFESACPRDARRSRLAVRLHADDGLRVRTHSVHHGIDAGMLRRPRVCGDAVAGLLAARGADGHPVAVLSRLPYAEKRPRAGFRPLLRLGGARLRPRAVVAARTENACASAGAGRVRRQPCAGVHRRNGVPAVDR